MAPVTTIEAPSTPTAVPRARTARVAVVRTRPETVLADYGRVMDLAGYRDTLSRDCDTLIKLNLSWTKYFPSCSSQPWQVDGVVGKMLADGRTYMVIAWWLTAVPGIFITLTVIGVNLFGDWLRDYLDPKLSV